MKRFIFRRSGSAESRSEPHDCCPDCAGSQASTSSLSKLFSAYCKNHKVQQNRFGHQSPGVSGRESGAADNSRYEAERWTSRYIAGSTSKISTDDVIIPPTTT